MVASDAAGGQREIGNNIPFDTVYSDIHPGLLAGGRIYVFRATTRAVVFLHGSLSRSFRNALSGQTKKTVVADEILADPTNGSCDDGGGRKLAKRHAGDAGRPRDPDFSLSEPIGEPSRKQHRSGDARGVAGGVLSASLSGCSGPREKTGPQLRHVCAGVRVTRKRVFTTPESPPNYLNAMHVCFYLVVGRLWHSKPISRRFISPYQHPSQNAMIDFVVSFPLRLRVACFAPLSFLLSRRLLETLDTRNLMMDFSSIKASFVTLESAVYDYVILFHFFLARSPFALASSPASYTSFTRYLLRSSCFPAWRILSHVRSRDVSLSLFGYVESLSSSSSAPHANPHVFFVL